MSDELSTDFARLTPADREGLVGFVNALPGLSLPRQELVAHVEQILAAHVAAARAEAWDEGAEATAEWSASYWHGDNGPPDPPSNPYDSTDRSSSTEGEGNGKQGGVHSEHPGDSQNGPGGTGLHVGSGVLAGAGSGPHGHVADGVSRGMTATSPGADLSPGEGLDLTPASGGDA